MKEKLDSFDLEYWEVKTEEELTDLKYDIRCLEVGVNNFQDRLKQLIQTTRNYERALKMIAYQRHSGANRSVYECAEHQSEIAAFVLGVWPNFENMDEDQIETTWKIGDTVRRFIQDNGIEL